MPVLVLDAGNALFKLPTPGGDPKEKERAGLLLEQMDALGTTAMAVGARDLTLGTDFLVKGTKDRKMKLLSANLVDAGGKLLFPASTVVTVGGVKFGLVGLSPEGPVATQKGLMGKPPLPAALAESRRLRAKDKVDVVVVLAAVPYLEAVRLSTEAGNAVDFIIQSNDSRTLGVAQREDFAVLVAGGERGRQLGRLELAVDGTGPFVDLDEVTRAQQNLNILDTNLQQAKQSLAAAKDERTRKMWQETIDSFETRRKGLVTQTEASKQGVGRTLRLSYLMLGTGFTDDPALKQRVERIQPPGSASH
ncbi:5'-nucleotidase [Vitiosangium sp. GDMCC 1.1324]|uniref:5'-nucleotidase n=1 Tax=Vitiosangium sp. (strain GDMCC 1.1324) TaxID=2138576 RepID=UPI000D33C2D0|nr:5'-nucleotidase [Vitiosangium sp. GDMCC 1.1324]PTL78749.1 5'-nucleotidase [Vitiosangium sp. GDMCC 1.1324]